MNPDLLKSLAVIITNSAAMKILLMLLFICSACITPSFSKEQSAGKKPCKKDVCIQDTMNPLSPFVF